MRNDSYVSIANVPVIPGYIDNAAITTSEWSRILIPIGALGVNNPTNITRVSIFLESTSTNQTFLVDHVRFTSQSETENNNKILTIFSS